MSTFHSENEDFGVAEGSTSARASTTSAMTLWQKFANWQNEMEECRSKVRNVRQQQEQYMAQIANLESICNEEMIKIEQWQEASGTSDMSGGESSVGTLKDLQRQLEEADKEYRIAAASLQSLQQQSAAQTDQRHETMQQILNQSHNFRWECQQVQRQLRTSVPAEDFLPSTNGFFRENGDVSKDVLSTAHSLRAALFAILASKPESLDAGSEDPWIEKALQDLEFFAAESVEPEEEVDENDPSTWTFIHKNDLEFHRVIAEYKRERQVLDATTQKLQDLQKKEEVMQTKAHDRNQRVVQLQEQLHRLQDDCSRMDGEISRYQQLILDDESLAHTYREKIDQRHRRQANTNAIRRIGLNVREEGLLGVSRPQPCSVPMPPLIPPIQSGRPEADLVAKTPAPFKNPYASSRKHTMEISSNFNTSYNGTEPTTRRAQANEDLAAVVLGRPSQRRKQQETITVEPPKDDLARNNSGRNYRNCLQFGCTLEVLNYDTTDNDGDAAAGAISKVAVDGLGQCKEMDEYCDALDDEDVLNFVALPSSSRNTPS